MQSGDGIGYRGHCAFLPARYPRSMLTGDDDTPIQRAQIVIMRRPVLLAPIAIAAQHPGHTVPSYSHASFVIAFILSRMDFLTIIKRARDTLLRRHGCEGQGVLPKHIGTQQDAFSL